MEKLQLDPIKYEIFFNKLDQAMNESQQVVRYLSASAIVREAGEALEAFYIPTGEAADIACGILMHFMNITRGIRYMIQNRYAADDIGIYEGDQFVNNDAYIGGMHVPDLCLVAPFFYKGEILGYAGAASHTTETGGIEPGGMCPSAKEAWHDGTIIPMVKLVEKGKIKRDIMNMFLRGNRDPVTWELDMKARMAGNERAIRRLTELADEFGPDFFKEATAALVEEGHTMARAKVKELKPGIYSCRTFCDTLGAGQEKLAVIQVDLEITGDGSLIVRCPVVSPQQPCFNNAYLPAVEATVMYCLLTQMLYNARWNSGAANILELDIPPHSRLNADPSQSVGYATVGIATVFGAAFTVALSRAYYAAGKIEEVQSGPGGSWNDMILAGLDYLGRPCATLFLSNGITWGGGGTVYKDGVTNYHFYNPWQYLPDAEGEEAKVPVMHLRLGFMPDSAAIGKNVSGYTGGAITMVHGSNVASAVHDGTGGKLNSSQGMFGGYSGPISYVDILTETNLYEKIQQGDRLPQAASDIINISKSVHGKYTHHSASVASMPFKAGDILVRLACGGGGGLGDPIERDPERIVADIRDEKATLKNCERVYCVAFEDPENLKIDYTATKKLREEKKQERLRQGIPANKFIKALVAKRNNRQLPKVALEFLDETAAFSPAFKQQLETEEQLAAMEWAPIGKTEVRRELFDLTPYVTIVEDNQGKNIAICSKCGFAYGRAQDDYKLAALIYERDPAEIYPEHLAPDKDWAVYREFYCPGCGTQVEAEQCPHGMTVIPYERIEELR